MIFISFFRTTIDVDTCLSALLGRYMTKGEFNQLLDIFIDVQGEFKIEEQEKMQIYIINFDKSKKMLRLDVQEIPLPL